MPLTLFFLTLYLLLLSVHIYALEVRFTPANDGDTNDISSLPLSAKYRASLRKLCAMLKASSSGGAALPEELRPGGAGREELERACQKLEKDDIHTGSRTGPGSSGLGLWTGIQSLLPRLREHKVLIGTTLGTIAVGALVVLGGWGYGIGRGRGLNVVDIDPVDRAELRRLRLERLQRVAATMPAE